MNKEPTLTPEFLAQHINTLYKEIEDMKLTLKEHGLKHVPKNQLAAPVISTDLKLNVQN